MSCFEVSGAASLEFLDALLANCVSRLDTGQAQYTTILDPEGTHLDDLFLYRIERDRFMLVANAANAERVMDWMRAVNSREVIVDLDFPGKKLDGPVEIRDLRNAGEESRVGLALQGPLSLRLMQELAESPADRAALQRLTANAFAAVTIAGADVIAARTGYTGEKMGFEIFVHPDAAPTVWNAFLEHGRPLGLLPCGLGARDSTRVEAGFPLFGHELEGPLGISIIEAGYGFVPRFHVPFFIGRDRFMRRATRDRRHVIRLRGRGRKTLRPGHVILDANGEVAGEVTSFAYIREDMTFIVLACVEARFRPQPGETVLGARITRDRFMGPPEERRLVELTLLTRFPGPEERDAWPGLYR